MPELHRYLTASILTVDLYAWGMVAEAQIGQAQKRSQWVLRFWVGFLGCFVCGGGFVVCFFSYIHTYVQVMGPPRRLGEVIIT